MHMDLKDIVLYIRNLKLSFWNLVKTTLLSSVTIIKNAMPFLSHVYLPREKMTSCLTLVVWYPSLRDCKQEEVRKNQFLLVFT